MTGTGRIQVVCPSSGRADVVSTKITGMLLYVAENEADAYREHNPDTPIVTHPDLPSMAAIRQSDMASSSRTTSRLPGTVTPGIIRQHSRLERG